MVLPRLTVLEDRYAIGRVLDEEQPYAVAYQAWNLQTEDQVVIKEYFPRSLAQREAGGTRLAPNDARAEKLFQFGLDQFLKEAAVLSEIEHPNLVRELEQMRSNGTAYRVVEHHAGAMLTSVLKQQGGKVNAKTALTILMPVLEGLKVAHHKGLIHGGISPDVIFLSKIGRPMLIDFHTAQIMLAQRLDEMNQLVREGYAAPEQYASEGPQGPWTDIYGCAATLFEMMTGDTLPSSAARQARDEAPARLEEATAIPEMLRVAIAEALALDPGDRPRNVVDFEKMLVDAMQHEPDSAVSSGSPRSKKKRTDDAPLLEPSVFESERSGNDTAEITQEILAAAEHVLDESPVAEDMSVETDFTHAEEPVEASDAFAAVPAAEPETSTLSRLSRAADRKPAARESLEGRRMPVLAALAAIMLVAFVGGYMLMNDGSEVGQFSHYKSRGDSLFALAQYAAAKDEYEQALTVRSDASVTARLTEAQQHLEQERDGHYTESMELGDGRYAQADSLQRAGETMEAMALFAEANKAYMEAVNLRPNDPLAIEKAQLASESMNRAFAQNGQTQANERSPEADEEAIREQLYQNYRKQGDELFGDDDFLAARRKFQEALEYRPGDRYARNRLEEIDSRVNQAQLEEEFSRLIARGNELCDAERCAEGRVEFERALELKPGNQQALNGIGRVDQALAARQQQDQRYQYFRGQGDIMLSQGNYEAAIASYESALQHKAGDAYAQQKIDESKAAIAAAQQEEAQASSIVQNDVYLVPEEAPQLVGGLAALHRKVQYPQSAYENGISGRVYVQFVVDERGRVQDAVVVRGIGGGCDEEALRVIRDARFEPGKVGGQAVKVRHTLFINFQTVDN